MGPQSRATHASDWPNSMHPTPTTRPKLADLSEPAAPFPFAKADADADALALALSLTIVVVVNVTVPSVDTYLGDADCVSIVAGAVICVTVAVTIACDSVFRTVTVTGAACVGVALEGAEEAESGERATMLTLSETKPCLLLGEKISKWKGERVRSRLSPTRKE